MIYVDETEPEGEVEAPFSPRDVQIRRGVNVREYFDMEKEIGRGKFGTVFLCREKSTGLRLAAKFIGASKKIDRINVEREVEIMKSLHHPRLIQLYDAFDDGKQEICLLLELIEGGELFERVIDDDFVLTERACAIFMRQICEAIEFMHSQSVLHLDMKPENILCLTKAGNRIKLIDFGLARKFDPKKKLQILFGTPEFVAPEVVNFEQIGFGTDLWSVGVIAYVLLSGLSPFMGETDVETMANVTIAKYDFDDEAFQEVSVEAKDYIAKLLVKDPSKRLTAAQCLQHPWLRRRPPLVPPPVKEKSPVAAKPVPVAPIPHPPVPAAVSTELEITKTNLREFVERWNSHPNSPYLFDSPRRAIALATTSNANNANGLNLQLESRTSMTALSPSSPQSSLSTPSLPSPASPNIIDDAEAFFHYTFDQVRLNGFTTNPEPAPDHTINLLQTVRETLVQNIEKRESSVRDRTGARIWLSRGASFNKSFENPTSASTKVGTEPKPTSPHSKRHVTNSNASNNNTTNNNAAVKNTTIHAVTQESVITSSEEWEIHPPVSSKTKAPPPVHRPLFLNRTLAPLPPTNPKNLSPNASSSGESSGTPTPTPTANLLEFVKSSPVTMGPPKSVTS